MLSSVLDGTRLERQGVPTAVICTETFEHEAYNVAAIQNLEGFQPIIIDHPLSSISDEEIKQRAEQAIETIIAYLQA